VSVVPATDSNIRRAADLIRGGGIVAFPTETVYGLGADALSASACARVFAVKRRPRFDPLIVHVADADELPRLSPSVDERVRRLAAAFWPGPLTLVLPKTDDVPDIVCAGLPTVAVRVPAHPVARALIVAAGRPIAAPSANPFGYISPTLASHVEDQIGSEVDLVLDGGPCEMGVESTIVDLSGERALLLRPGATEAERIEALIGPLERPGAGEAPRAPGQLASHYAPRTPVVLLAGRATTAPGPRLGLLAFGRPEPRAVASYSAVEVLTESGDLREAAARLFAAMHRLDRLGLDAIHAEPVPPEGLGLAILDRLRRAAAGGTPRARGG
jgi:L-threonylcarbamoyladenylate synthase